MTLRVTLAALAASTAAAHAATHHVATTGNDSSAGLADAPWRTIQRAADAVVPGDTVIIHAGTYTGFVVDAAGTQAAPIRFVGDGTVRIDGAATADRDAVHVEGASWVTIEGLTVTGATRAGISALECDHITVRGNRVDQNGRWGVFSSFCDDLVVEDNEVSRSGTEHGVYASNSADRPIIRRNLIWGNGACGVHMNGDINFGGDGVISGAVVEANVIRDNGTKGGSGINGDGVTGALIRNNVLDGNHASGISLYQIDGGLPSTGNVVVNNTVRMASGARWALNLQDGASGTTVRNNILLHPSASRGAIDICTACLPGLASNHNVMVGRFLIGGAQTDLAGWRSRTGGDGASFSATDAQLFTNAATGDLTLRDGSPAIDKGMTTLAPPTDVAGAPRPQGDAVDIGAYEYCDGDCPSSGGDGGSGGGDGDGDGDGGSGGDDGGGGDEGPRVEQDSGGCAATASPSWLAAVLGVALLAVSRRPNRRSLRDGRRLADDEDPFDLIRAHRTERRDLVLARVQVVRQARDVEP